MAPAIRSTGADFTTSVTQAWVCVGNSGSSKLHVSTLKTSATVRVTNLNTGDSRLIATDTSGQFTGRLQSFASPGNMVSFQVEGQTNPTKDRTARSCLRNASDTILIHEFSDTDVEMTAFQGRTLDIVDWPVPKDTLDQWRDCSGTVAIVETCFDATTNPGAQVTLSSHVDLGMFQYDLNSFRSPTNNPAFRKAVGYLADRQTITLLYGGGQATPICAGLASGQPGSKDCVRLGYPSSFGELNLEKAIQVLNEAGFVDTNANGVLELTPGVDVPAVIMYIRLDDTIRSQAGILLKNLLENLPNSYKSKATGTTVMVCPSTPICKFNIEAHVVDRRIAAPIVFTTPWDDWNIYTGGWGLGLDPDHLIDLYGSQSAPVGCSGGWPGNFPLNYPCYVDPTFDTLVQPLRTGRTYSDILAAAQAAEDYAWGYDSGAGKIKGTMPTVPLYTFTATKAAWKRDQGDFPLLTDGSTGSSTSPVMSRACWRNFVPQRLGTGLDNLATLEGLYLDNCKLTKTDYVSFRGRPGSILDWGFKSTIEHLNIVTSQWLWDILAMQQTYQPLLDRNPVNPSELIPVLAESYGETTYLNQALGREATVAVYKLRGGVLWSDGTPLTADDVKFSIEYVRDKQGWNSPLVDHVIRVDVTDPLTLHVYFDNVGALFTQNAGFLPIIPKHVWCVSWPNTSINCAYPIPDSFPDSDFTKQVGTGPYMITGCTGTHCVETITLKTNPYYLEGRHYWSLAAGISLQPDLNGDDQVNSQDLAMVNEAMSSSDPLLDVDYRPRTLGSQNFPNALGTGTITVSLKGVLVDATDKYIVQRLVNEATDPTGLLWPPRRITYTWPDVDRDNDVDLDDVIRVYLNQFADPTASTGLAMHDVDYDGDIDVDDLITTFVHEFTRPPGAQ